MYLIERKGVSMNLRYSIHFYGPYSEELDNAIRLLAANDVINIDTSERTHKISILDSSSIDYDLMEEEINTINFILDNFSDKTPNELEALTTLDFVAKEIIENNGSHEDIINEVLKIKGTKFTTYFLKEQLELLKECGFISQSMNEMVC